MTDHTPKAGLFRRLAALLYDSLLLFGVLVITSALILLINRGEPTSGLHPVNLTYPLVIMLFFGWFWRHGGQTLGMRAWRLKIEHEHGGDISWAQVLLRCLAAIPALALGGLGYWWILWDREKRSWHDMFSHTRIVLTDRN